MTPREGKGAWRSDIEGLRGVAVLLVVLYHAGVPGAAGGYVGVDVFFVLSGYLITGLLVGEVRQSGTVDLLRFYGRRARRLLPASALVLAATVAASAVLFSPIDQAQFAKTVVATALYLSNVFFARRATDYLGSEADANPLLHMWSLSVEEQFYLVWPVLILLAMRLGRRRLPAVLAAVVVVSLGASVWLTEVRQPWAFFSSPTRAWEFAVGGLAVVLFPTPGAGPAWRLVGWLGLAAVGVAGVTFDAATAFPGVAAALPVAGTVGVLVARGAGGLDAVLGVRPLQVMGRLSYGWYLWHWPVLVFLVVEVPDVGLGGKLAAAAASLGLAAASYRWVEAPVRHAKRLQGRPGRSVGLAVALTVAGVAVAGAGYGFAVWAGSQGRQQGFVEAYSALPDYYDDGCNSTFFETAPETCLRGDADADRTVVVLGDSHAGQWLPAFDAAAAGRGWRLAMLVKESCPAVDLGALYSRTLGRDYTECPEWRTAALASVDEIAPDLVVVAWSGGYLDDAGLSEREWTEAAERTLLALRKPGRRLAVVPDNPAPNFEVARCHSTADWRGHDGSECTFPRREAARDASRRVVRAAAASVGAEVWTFAADVCQTDECPTVAPDGTLIYRDASHLTTAFARTLAPTVASLLDAPARATAAPPARPTSSATE